MTNFSKKINNILMIAVIACVISAVAIIFLLPKKTQPQSIVKAIIKEVQKPVLSDESKKEINLGLAAAGLKDWKLAIDHFNKARELSPKASEPLFNLALATDKAGGRELIAIPWYCAYLAAAPKAENREQVLSRIAELEVAIESRIRKLLNWDRELVAQMKCEELEVDMATSHGEAIIAQYEAGDIEGIAATAAKITNEYWRSEMLCKLVEWQIKSGDITGALRILELMNRNDDYVVEAYCKVAEALAKAGRKEEALSFAQKAEPFSAGIKKELLNNRLKALLWIAKTYSVCGDKTQAKKYFDMCEALTREGEFQDIGFGIDARSLRLYSYAELALEEAKAGFSEDAKKNFNTAREEALKYTKVKDKFSHLAQIASIQKNAGDMTASQATLNEAKAIMPWITPQEAEKYKGIDGRFDLTASEDAWKEDFKDRNFMTGSFVRICIDMNDLEEAEKALNTMAEYWEGPTGRLSQAKAKAGDVDGATKLARKITEFYAYDKAQCYVEIAKKQAEKGDMAAAEASAKLSIAGHENNIDFRRFPDDIYKEIVSLRLKRGDFTGAREFAGRINSLREKFGAYRDIARDQAAKGAVKDSVSLWTGIAIRNANTAFISDLTAFLKSISGKEEKAEDVVKKVMDTLRATTAALQEVKALQPK